MNRTQTKQIHVGSVAIGGGAPVAVQSMCNTHTSDAHATILNAGVRYEHVKSDYYAEGVLNPDMSRKYDNVFPNVSLGDRKSVV